MTAPIFIRTGVRIKRHQYDAYRKVRNEMQQLMKAQKNVELFLRRTRAISDRSIPDKRMPPRSFPSWEASSADFCLCSRFKMLDLFC